MRRLGLLVLLLLALALPSSAQTRVMAVTDLHYLAPELYRDSEGFLRALRAADGRLTQWGETLMAALTAQVLAAAPDALVITGDLSFNGERASHEALAEWLRGIEAAGIPVWVIPGNHDINSPSPRGWDDDGWYPAEGVDEAAFRRIYADFLGPVTPGANLSCCAEVSDELWLAMTDVSYYAGTGQTFGLFTAGHAAWLEDTLRRAAEAGAEVVTATHHSLEEHTAFSRDSYLMYGHETMAALTARYGVRLNLSGHLHIQHIVRGEGTADAALEAFCVWPHRYALVTLSDDGSLTYEVRALDEAFLPAGFGEMSRDWFYGVSADKVEESLAESGLDEADVRSMADFAARFNLAYFSGTLRADDPVWTEDPAAAAWRSAEGVFGRYLSLVMGEAGGEHLYLRLP